MLSLIELSVLYSGGIMGITYSVEQQKVIDARSSHVLVSAAAGSGKTAVLVERIIRLLTDADTKLSIQQLLVVTFTKLAAKEMRERIGRGIEKAIDEATDPLLVRHLLKQLTLLPTANIMTLHSFCLTLLKNHYPVIQLDPKFRIGNETELVLMQEELLDDILESEYERGSSEFIQVIESFSPGKNDEPLKDLILQIYRFSMSYPWPKEWLWRSLEKMYIPNREALIASEYFKVLTQDVQESIHLMEIYLSEIEELMLLDGGPTKYKDTLSGYRVFIEEYKQILQEQRYEDVSGCIRRKNIPPLNRSSKGYDKDLAKEAKGLFDDVKKMIEGECTKLLFTPKSFIELQQIQKHTEEVVRLTERFMDEFAVLKEGKGIIDFNDIEHFALKLLYNKKDYSEIAHIYKNKFYEVLVDEYQDTNEVQESILKAVSKEMQPHNNLFMVGDLKQSIYRFRLAKPEIFSRKYDAFTYEPSNQIKIDLSKNFRSRKEVINFTNHMCGKVMSREVGDVSYDEHASLYYGALNYSIDDSTYKPELIFIEEKEAQLSKTLLQGKSIARKIHQLMTDDTFKITDKSGELRKPKLKDICILMRSPSSIINELKDVLDEEKIAYFLDQSSGYFDAIEVQIILNVLRILDNPYQDIPLVSILRSSLIQFTEKELMEIRKFMEDGTFFESLKALYEAEPLNSPLYPRLHMFFSLYEELKRIAQRVTLSHLIRQIYSKTGYPYTVSFMENGQQRFTNLQFLEKHARKFEQSSYKGLFNFIRYIDHIKKYEIDIPEPFSDNNREDQISIMSIHKSKGLEFPIVFLMDCQRQFNKMDLRKNFMLHQELGFGCDYIDYERHIKKESVFTKAIKSVSERELVSEELRLFYVAMTRAKEKLFLVATVKNFEEKGLLTQEKFEQYNGSVPSALASKANSLLDFILMSCPASSKLYDSYYINETDIQVSQAFDELAGEERKQQLLDILEKETPIDVSYVDELFKPYHHEAATKVFATLSVSEIKEIEQAFFEPTETQHVYEPRFLNDQDAVLQGTRFGTLMHKVLMHIPLLETIQLSDVNSFIQELCVKHVIQDQDMASIDAKKIFAFTQTRLYQRMVLANKKKSLYQEQPFVLGVYEEEDLRMIQGVIDVFFEEENEIILIDYKTDYVKVGDEERLLKKYGVQLGYYKQAIEDILHKKVKEVYIYSLTLGKELLY